MRKAERFEWAPFGRVVAVMEIDRVAVGDSAHLIGRLLDVDARHLARMRRDGLTLDSVEKFCHRIGRHPSEIWESWEQVEQLVDAS
jgi:hypothetical protein